MKNLKRSVIALSLLLVACAHAPQQAVTVSQNQPDPRANPHEIAEQPLNLPNLELTEQMLYEFLLAEVSAQRSNPGMGAQIYLNLAKSTRDPRVARRAVHLSFGAQQMEQTLEALNLWLELDPTSQQAKQLLITMLLTGGKLDEARPYLIEVLASKPDKAAHTFIQSYPLLARHSDKEAVLNLMRELTQPYPRVAEGRWALAKAAEAAGKREMALSEVSEARALLPSWETTAILEAQLLLTDSPQQALDVLKKYLAEYPEAGEARLFYARTLLDQKKYADSRVEFQRLLDANPENADMAFAVAVLSLELGDLEPAEKNLRQALVSGKKDEATVYYYLGQLSEAKKNDEEAIQNYRKVEGGDYLLPAHARVAYLYNRAGKLDEAREYLHQAVAQDNQQRVQLIMLESHLLRDANKPEVAFEALKLGLEKLPNHPVLLYEAAMLADRIGKFDAFEQMMRKLIEVSPDQAQAYNALGYSLLDRNDRVQEGMQLVEKAIQLAPNDAAVMDSVGWGHYRLGDYAKSLEFLRRAFAAIPDPEIAAHLGEVLWMQGDKDQAKKLWGETLKSFPDNEVLQAVMKKFLP